MEMEYRKLWKEAEAQLGNAHVALIAAWKETKNKDIEDYFRKTGGIIIDGKYMFGKLDKLTLDELQSYHTRR